MAFCKAVPILTATLTGLTATGVMAPSGTAGAQPPLHHVRYTIGASQDIANAEIYYRQTDPPNWADYSHNPYLFTPNVEADLGPNKPWVYETWLADPDQWAMVVVGLPAHTSPALPEPGFVCEMRVDDVVVATDSGTKGALCSLRPW
ncbi:hypothetical protein [Mycolicibacterium sp.]|uniref:hypothetical protein n=1 Tax=Mycolicibacterium sp. TaxID=2320850 RepID=UPI003D09810D